MTAALTAICGALGGDPAATGGTLAAMLDALAADYGGEVRAAPAQESARLGVVSTAAASAFCRDHTAGLACVADARLDDRDALCDALAVPPPQRSGLADSALVLRAVARWGEAAPEHLLGDYAFAVWDENRRTLFCARDHAGARPLYYACITAEPTAPQAARFVFASTVAAVLAAPGVSPAFDEAALAAQLGSAWPDRRARSCYRAVRRVPAGHCLIVAPAPGRTGGIRTRMVRHWRPEELPAVPPASDDAYGEQFRELFDRAVRDRLPGGPVGVHLSGGLDTSGVAVHAARALRAQGRPPPPAFSWQPPLGGPQVAPARAAEYDRIDAVCRQEGLRVFHCGPQPEDVLNVLRLDATLPGADVAFAEPVVVRRARDLGVRVLLAGGGGDGCASHNGYGHWQGLLLRGGWRALAAEWRAEARPAWRLLARAMLPLLHPALPMLMNHWRRGRGLGDRWFVAPALARRAKPLTTRPTRAVSVRREQLRFLQDGRFEFQEQQRSFGIRAGIEYRFPLLDRRLLEFALGLPPEQFRRPAANRWIMRHALRHSLPPTVCWNPIKGEPIRAEALARAIAAALPTIRQRIERRTPSRAPYVDIPALLAQMRQDPIGTASHFMPARAALAFLDI